MTQGLCLIFQLKLGNDCISNAKKLCVKLENVKDVLKKLAEKTYCLARISTKMNQLTHNLIRKKYINIHFLDVNFRLTVVLDLMENFLFHAEFSGLGVALPNVTIQNLNGNIT